jgi:FKBP-type peptidyl-prolyl cis-trans isomerase
MPKASDTAVKVHYKAHWPTQGEFGQALQAQRARHLPAEPRGAVLTEGMQVKITVGGKATLTCPLATVSPRPRGAGGVVPPTATLTPTSSCWVEECSRPPALWLRAACCIKTA